MAGYQAENYADLVTTTLRHLQRTTWEDIVLDNQEHVAMNQILRKESVRFGSGYGYQFNVRLFSNNGARNVRLAQEDNPTTSDVMKTGNIPWRNTETKWAMEERIIAMNRSPARLVDLLEVSKMDAMTDLAEQMETNFWSKPTSSSDDLAPYGVAYWIVKNATEGFTGGAPSGFTDVGALSPTTYPRWKNYSAQYTTISKADLIRKMRKACVKTVFRPPVPYPSSSGTGKPRWGIYTTYAVIQAMEELLEAQNDNLGADLARYDGESTFRRTPVTWVPWLDNNDSTNPVFGLNWKAWKIAFLSGEYMKESDVIRHPFQHRTITQYTDCTYNFCCENRRLNWVMYQ